MGREILFVRVAFAGEDAARQLVMQNETVWTARVKERKKKKKSKKTKRKKNEKTDNVGHQLGNVGRIRSRDEKKNVGMKQNGESGVLGRALLSGKLLIP